MKRIGRALAGLALVAATLAVLCAVPIVTVEHSCFVAPAPRPGSAPAFDVADSGYRRAEGDSFLSYPEWYIVHAYADLAGVTAQSSESSFDYLASIRGFWSSLCRASETASRIGPVTADQKTTNYVIGISFTVEMALQGLYERSIGAMTVWMRGDRKTAEDAFNSRLLQDYAAFLEQTPWYEFPFGRELVRFWRETPFRPSARSVDRRFALSLQYAAKSAYAALIRYAAGYAPADLSIRSVVGGLEPADFAADGRIRPVRELVAADGTQAYLIETPRYREFTEIVRELGRKGRVFYQIAGNARILTTVIVPPGEAVSPDRAVEIFSLPIQSRPGWRRVGFDTAVPALAAQAGATDGKGAAFEHAYDY